MFRFDTRCPEGRKARAGRTSAIFVSQRTGKSKSGIVLNDGIPPLVVELKNQGEGVVPPVPGLKLKFAPVRFSDCRNILWVEGRGAFEVTFRIHLPVLWSFDVQKTYSRTRGCSAARVDRA